MHANLVAISPPPKKMSCVLYVTLAVGVARVEPGPPRVIASHGQHSRGPTLGQTARARHAENGAAPDGIKKRPGPTKNMTKEEFFARARAAREQAEREEIARQQAALRALEAEHAPSAMAALANARAWRSRAACWGELAVGGWNRSADKPAYGGDTCNKRYRSKRPFDFAYAPLRRSLDVPRVRAASFCSVLQRRGVGRVAFIGDSITTNHYAALALLVGEKVERVTESARWVGNASSGWRPMHPAGLGSYMRGLMNVTCPDSGDDSGDRGRRPAELHPTPSSILVQHVPATPYFPGTSVPATAEAAASNFLWRDALAAVREADVSVINVGAHYAPRQEEYDKKRFLGNISTPYPLARQLDLYTRDLQAFAAGLRELEPRHRLIVWRTIAPGHPGCEDEWLPLSRWEQRNASAARWAACPQCVDSFAWALFPAYDALARSLLEPLGVRVLDVAHMSAQRPDAHSECRYGGGRLPADCLHWMLPGVPDWWNALLLSSISECEGRRLPLSPAV